MEKRELGKSGEKVSVIGMGTWTMGDAAGDKRLEEIEALRKGLELGMTFIDTAEVYGSGRAESLVGEAIKEIRDDVFVASKVWPDNFAYDSVIASCESSIRRLGVKHIDLYQLHWPSKEVPIQETMRAMEELVTRGKIRYIGISNFSASQAREAQEALPRSEIVSDQVRYSITHRSVESQLIPFCEKERITVIAYTPLDSGMMPQSRIPRGLLDKYDLTSAQVMLNWVTYKDAVMAIPKASRVEHVEANAASIRPRLSREDYQLLSKRFARR